MVLVDPEDVRGEAKKWINLADDMAGIRSVAENRLELESTAFFIGNFSEIVHYPAYQDFHGRMVSRLRGAQVEFELIGLVLKRLADDYEETDQLSSAELGRAYTVTDEDVATATDEDPGRGPGTGGRRPGYQKYT